MTDAIADQLLHHATRLEADLRAKLSDPQPQGDQSPALAVSLEQALRAAEDLARVARLDLDKKGVP